MYWTVFISLILGGMGFPIPEEVPLIIGGIAVASEALSAQLMFFICLSGVLIGDQFMYMLGALFGKRLLEAGKRSPLLPSITEERVNEVREGLRKKKLLYLFIGRHLFFLRSVTFLVAGSLHIPYREFFFTDAFAALFSVSLFFGLGYFLGNRIHPDLVPVVVHYARVGLLVIVVLAGIIGALFVSQKYRRGEKKEADSL